MGSPGAGAVGRHRLGHAVRCVGAAGGDPGRLRAGAGPGAAMAGGGRDTCPGVLPEGGRGRWARCGAEAGPVRERRLHGGFALRGGGRVPRECPGAPSGPIQPRRCRRG